MKKTPVISSIFFFTVTLYLKFYLPSRPDWHGWWTKPSEILLLISLYIFAITSILGVLFLFDKNKNTDPFKNTYDC